MVLELFVHTIVRKFGDEIVGFLMAIGDGLLGAFDFFCAYNSKVEGDLGIGNDPEV